MVTPREQKEMVIAYSNKTKDEFAEAFHAKYAGTMPVMKLTGRIRSLWDCRHTHAEEIAKLKAEEINLRNLAQRENHTVMIPARIVSKHTPSRDAVPDVGEILIRTNHLLAEMVQLQKEQIALFKEIQGGKK
jgi:hypothetical protein